MATDFTVAARAEQLAEVTRAARELAKPVDISSALTVIVERLGSALACGAAGVVLVENGQLTSAAASGPLVEQADELQIKYAQGPGLDATTRAEDVVVDDLRDEHRWPEWRPAAADLGWRSVSSLGLTADERPFGAVNLYSCRPGFFSIEELPLGQALAAQAAIALAGARERESLLKAVDARHAIGQAQGILMERYNVDAEKAFTVLRRYSSHTNRKLRIVAEEIVRTRRLPSA